MTRSLLIVRTLLVVIAAALVACETPPPLAPLESWVADIRQTQELLLMDITNRSDVVSGDGTLASLTNVGGERLTVSGRRMGDSLSVTFHRETGPAFTFDGKYVGPGIGGVLHGAHFDSLTVLFIRP